MEGVNSSHVLFNMLAAATGAGVTLLVRRRWAEAWRKPPSGRAGLQYFLALAAGTLAGGFLAGTANAWISGVHGLAHSLAGALAGGILAVELFKRRAGIQGSTGAVFVVGLAASIAIGRWGCFFAGLEDFTYGTPTSLPFGVNFGDGVARHPVQLYESAAMALFLPVAMFLLARRTAFFMANGFYLFAVWYGAQRFLWEFLKPYGAIIGPFNLFHFICAGLVLYGLGMMRANIGRAAA